MAEDNRQDDLERTEEPTPKRREEARKHGQFARSRELIAAASLLIMIVLVRFTGAELIEREQRLVTLFFSIAGNNKQFGDQLIADALLHAGWLVGPILLLLFGATVLAALGCGFMQSGMVLATEPLHIDFTRINPLNGFRRLMSLDALLELVKALLFITVLGYVGGGILYGQLPAIVSLAELSAAEILVFIAEQAAPLATWCVVIVGEQEGDPLLRAQLRSLRHKMARRRMMSEVAKADVVVTNPTELAVALRYRASETRAPKVVGKGAGFIAEKIRDVARSNGITIVENKPLARLLFREVEIGQEIPEGLYRAVAETLAYVYRLRRARTSADAQPVS
jgi:flagellar biosynthetic protein FlhB